MLTRLEWNKSFIHEAGKSVDDELKLKREAGLVRDKKNLRD